jgi:predicted metal-dependent hydrolase
MAIEITNDLQVMVRAPLRLDKKSIDRFVERYAGWIDKAIEKRKRLQQKESPPMSPEREGELRRLAHAVLPAKTEHYGRIMGMLPTGVKITSAKTRYGSCSSKNSICYSWRLMEKCEAAIDYVVVHELAHLAHKNHGAQFYACVQKVLPDCRERRKFLKLTPMAAPLWTARCA